MRNLLRRSLKDERKKCKVQIDVKDRYHVCDPYEYFYRHFFARKNRPLTDSEVCDQLSSVQTSKIQNKTCQTYLQLTKSKQHRAKTRLHSLFPCTGVFMKAKPLYNIKLGTKSNREKRLRICSYSRERCFLRPHTPSAKHAREATPTGDQKPSRCTITLCCFFTIVPTHGVELSTSSRLLETK